MSGFFKAVDKFKPVYDVAYKIVLFLCKLLLVADILITCMSVLGRYVPFIPDPAWSEEVVLTLMSYMAVLSAALAIVMVVVGWKYASTLGAKGSYVSMPSVSRFWMYFPIPIAGVAMIVFELEALYNHIKNIFVKEGDK